MGTVICLPGWRSCRVRQAAGNAIHALPSVPCPPIYEETQWNEKVFRTR